MDLASGYWQVAMSLDASRKAAFVTLSGLFAGLFQFRREMLTTVTMCNHFRGAQFTLCTDHRSLRWLQKFHNGDGMLARWYMLLGQFSVTFKYRSGSQDANVASVSARFVRWGRRTSPSLKPVLPRIWTFRRVCDGWFHGYGPTTGVVRWDVAGCNPPGRGHRWLASAWLWSWFYCFVSYW